MQPSPVPRTSQVEVCCPVGFLSTAPHPSLLWISSHWNHDRLHWANPSGTYASILVDPRGHLLPAPGRNLWVSAVGSQTSEQKHIRIPSAVLAATGLWGATLQITGTGTMVDWNSIFRSHGLTFPSCKIWNCGGKSDFKVRSAGGYWPPGGRLEYRRRDTPRAFQEDPGPF